MTERTPCRLFVILAREARMGVILRRGPSKWVRLIKWNTSTDTFEPGHWFNGRIYENTCDLSPDGRLLVYFAQKITGRAPRTRDYTHVWTAISRPPWLTALALWFKGDCCVGGGLFGSDNTVWINHEPELPAPDKGDLLQNLGVDYDHKICDPRQVYATRLERDGWHLRQEMQVRKIAYGYATDSPEIWSKRLWAPNVNLLMANSMREFDVVSDYILEDCETRKQQPVIGATWADWDHQGRLVFAEGGRLFVADPSTSAGIDPVQIADFNDDVPAQIQPPEWATVW